MALCAFACCIAGGVSFLRGGDVKAAAATAPVYNTLEAFTIEEEGSIRTSDYNGIRFRTVLEQEELDAIDALGLSNMQYGTLILPADYLGSQELTHATANVLDIQTKKWQQEGTEWTSVLAGAKDANGEYTSLPESYNNRPLVARSYVTGIKDGVTVYYYTENTVVRSIGYVAHMEEQTQESVTDQVANISKDADIRVEFVNENQISANQSEPANGAVELISNKLPNSTEKMAVLTIGGVPYENAKVSYEYTTSNADVISVNGTTVVANKVGKATITVTATYVLDEENETTITRTATREINTDTFVGASEYKILISDEAKNASAITYANFANGGIATSAQYEKAAAELLQKIFAEATGVELPIVTSADDKFISIGATGKETGKAVSTTKDTSSQVFVDGYNVYILGKKAPEAVYYGTHQFLTDTVGYEFLMENTYSYDANTEVQAAATAYEPDIEYNVIQSDLRVDGVMDGYFMQDYTRDMIALGINKGATQKTAFHQGIAHNSVLVVDALTRETSTIYVGNGSSTVDWYATGTTYSAMGVQSGTFKTITNPYYDTTGKNTTSEDTDSNTKDGNVTSDPFATCVINDDGTKTWTYYKTIKAELCYTAHGYSSQRTALIKVVADEMIAQLKANPERTRLGFSHMDHRIWCTCSSCTTQGNPSDNLLEFLLDVAAAVKSRWSETERKDSSDNFKISSLFYHATNLAPKNTKNYETKLSDYGKHVEIWFAETGADYLVPLDDTTSGSEWNTAVHNNLKVFKDLGTDMLWWGYYGTTMQFYVPYDSLNAIRGNYALAKAYGIDFMFNQMMSSTQNFARLKEYLMSKLAWNADVEDNEWNGWIESYFKGAYGAGSDKMRAYYNSWSQWCKDNWNSLKTNSEYNATATSVDGSIGRTEVLDKDDEDFFAFSETTLKDWINTIDQAISALDPNDPNYDTYYWNIKREKATPLYLMMYIFGDNRIESGEGLNTWDAPTDYTDAEFDGDTSYVLKYGAEFLEIIAHCDLAYFGEGRSIDIFKTAIENVLSNATTTTVKDDQIVDAGSSLTLKHTAITAGDYTVRVISADGVTSPEDEVKASAGSITIPATITAGKTYIVELLSSAGNVIRFTNVHTRTENANHQVMAKTQYMFCDEQDLLLKDSAIKAGTTYTVKIDTRQYTATSYVNGKLSVPIGQMAVNTNKKVLCDDGATTYEFNVICANPIRTAEDLKALGMGNNNNTALKDITGYYVLANDITFVHQDDWSDLIAAGYDAASDGVKDDKGNYINKYHFKGVFDGNGYTIDNMRVSDGGIFGTATEATIKNVNLTNVHLIEDIPTGLSEQNGGYIAIFAYTAPKSTFENINITMATSPNNKWTWKRDGLFVCSGSSGAATFRNITVDASGLTLKTLLGISHNTENVYENVVIKAADYVAVGYTGDSYTDPDGDNIGEQNTAVMIAKGQYPSGVEFQTVGLCITTEETEVRANGSLTVKTNQTQGVTYSLETEIEGVEINKTTGVLTVSSRVEIGTKITVIATSADGSAKKTFTVIRALETYTAAVQNVEMGHYLDGTTVVMGATSATIDLSEIYDTYLAGSNVTVTCGDTTWYQGVFGSNSWTITLNESMKSWNGIKNFVFTSETNTCEYEITLPVNFVQGVIELDKDNVGSPTDLQAIMKSNMGGHYVLTSDLNMGGNTLKGVEEFSGVLDGNGYAIVNATLLYDANPSISYNGKIESYAPVFIIVNKGTVKDIRFELLNYAYNEGSSLRGIVAYNHGEINNVYVEIDLQTNLNAKNSVGDTPSVEAWGALGILGKVNYGTVNNVIVKATSSTNVALRVNEIAGFYYKNNAGATINNSYLITDVGHVEPVFIEGTATVEKYDAWNDTLVSKISSWSAPWANPSYGVCFGNSVIYEDPNATATEIEETLLMSIKDGVVTLPDGIDGTIKSVTFNGTEIFVSADGNTMTFDGSAIATADLGASKTLIVRTSENKYQLQATMVTDIITTVAELKALGMGGNNKTATAHMTGYYILGNDIIIEHQDNYSDLLAAGYGSPTTGDYRFKATFDGNGYTIHNARVSDGGLFGKMDKATVKNVNLTNVHFLDNLSNTVTNQSGGEIGLFAYQTYNGVTFENINITVATAATGDSWKRFGLFVRRSDGEGADVYRKIKVDASGLTLKTLLGTNYDANNTYENVLIKAAGYNLVAYVNDTVTTGVENITQLPSGVTFTRTNSMVAQNSSYTWAYEVYQGDVTDLGFAEGTRVVKSGIDVSNWNTAYPSRAKLGYIEADYDYVDIPFLTTNALTIVHVWTPQQHFTISPSGVVTHDADDPGRTAKILDAKGNKVSSFAANTVYTLRVYIDDANGTAATELSLTLTLQGNTGTIYFGDVSFGDEVEISVEELDATVTISIKDGTFALPTGVQGTVTSVLLDGGEIFTSVSDGVVTFNKEVMPTDVTMLGAGKTLIIMTDKANYSVNADIYTDVITTADELRALGVGYSSGQVAVTGYYVLGNDIDCTNAEVFAAGHGINVYFSGVFDGNNYTIKNIKVNTGGIFGNTNGATIKNVNFTGVIYDAVSYADTYGAWGNYTALLACNAAYTTFEKIDVQVAETKFSFNNDNEHFYEAVLFVIANGTVSVKDVTVDATDLALENVLGLYIDTENVTVNFENVLVKAASYSTIGYAAGVNADLANTDDEVKEWPNGVTFKLVANPKDIANVSGGDLTAYTGDVTELGFAAGTKVFSKVSNADTYAWDNRISVPVLSAFDYVEFDVVFGSERSSLTGWPYYNGSTIGSFTLATTYMSTNDGAQRKTQVFDASGNLVVQQGNFAANTRYTVRIGINADETLSAFHLGLDTSGQTYYISQARYGQYNQSELWVCDTGATLAKYEGDVTAIGFAEGTTVRYKAIENANNDRLMIDFNKAYDYVDIEFSFADNRTIGAFCLWDGVKGHYDVYVTGGVSAAGDVANERTIQVFDANGNAVSSFVAHTRYKLRVYIKDVNGENEIKKLQFTTWSTSADDPAVLYFGNITFGNDE
ncbi:MAG: DUF4838 domain-containing protein [Clostridia bacterium]|nr:DUF4838 domain-containing protein [Clostridia bacterium]